jgi:hypothetical protein
MPSGFLHPEEARLGETPGFLNPEQQNSVLDWWLRVRRGANTPNWDIVSTCTIADRPGLLLVEAKAYHNELEPNDCCGATNQENLEQIGAALGNANQGLEAPLPGWRLTRDPHYQLWNRFAWSWRVATLGVPVILVYLGFLNSDEMADKGQSFQSLADWTGAIRRYADGFVPDRVWDCRLEINGTPMWSLIRARDLRWETGS